MNGLFASGDINNLIDKSLERRINDASNTGGFSKERLQKEFILVRLNLFNLSKQIKSLENDNYLAELKKLTDVDDFYLVMGGPWIKAVSKKDNFSFYANGSNVDAVVVDYFSTHFNQDILEDVVKTLEDNNYNNFKMFTVEHKSIFEWIPLKGGYTLNNIPYILVRR